MIIPFRHFKRRIMESGMIDIRGNKKGQLISVCCPFSKSAQILIYVYYLLLINNNLLWPRYLFEIFWENDRQHPILKTGMYIIGKHVFI